jgi:hypothetical protein
MSSIDIEGDILDSFHIAFQYDKWAIDPKHVSMRVEEEVNDRLHVCRKLRKTYAVYVVIAELAGDRDAISQRQASQNQERFFDQCEARNGSWKTAEASGSNCLL